jgi:purine-nucleoside phosphorylase
MNHASEPIVRPVCGKNTPKLGTMALMAASDHDAQTLLQFLDLPDRYRLYMSQVFFNASNKQVPAVVGPAMGAPYAAMLLEILRAWGVRKLVFFGWCGSIHETVRTGDIIVPTGALVEEGTSPLYMQKIGAAVAPDQKLLDHVMRCLNENGIVFHKGFVWTTDAVFRETPEKVLGFRQQGALAVEMELSALLSVGVFHGIAVAGALAVSDELFSMHWRPGFKSEVFVRKRTQLAGILAGLFF